MITKFGTLYAGHVDLGDIGLGATAVNDRRFDNDHLSTIFDRVEQMVKVMDDPMTDIVKNGVSKS